jgi:hypothetical protein
MIREQKKMPEKKKQENEEHGASFLSKRDESESVVPTREQLQMPVLRM